MTTMSTHPYRSKLDFETAEAIRARSRRGESVRTLAEAHGVCLSTIYDLLSERSHPPTVTVRLRGREFMQLLRLAHDADEDCAEFAATLLRRGLARAR